MIDLTTWWDRLAGAMQHPTFHAVVLAVVLGIAVTEFLAHLLPASWPKTMVERTMRIVVAIAVALAGYQFHPTTIGAGWAAVAGLMSPSLHHHLQAWAYAKWPVLKPQVLK